MRRLVALILGLALWALPSWGQPRTPQLILAFAQDESQVTLTGPTGTALTVQLGMSLPVGTRIQTRSSAVELQLRPNGTIIRINPNTTFVVEDLEGVSGGTSNNFHLQSGRSRVVAARVPGQPQAFSVRTPTAVGGVRGTDFVINVGAGLGGQPGEWIAVREGEVSFTNTLTGQTLALRAGQFADALAATFQALTLPADQLNSIFASVPFEGLNPAEVPGQQAQAPQPTQQPPAEAAPAPLPQAPAEEPLAQEQPDQPAEEDPVTKLLRDILNMELGAITIGSTTYSKAILQPNIEVGSFRLGLYLPIIYTKNMFDPDDWHRPAGNYEWSFGTDASFGNDWLARIRDFATDLVLKIKYLEIGRPAQDPWYLKIGSLNTMTLGLGTLMRGFANDQDFPSFRRIGFNAGFEVGGVVFEAVFDDLTRPQVMGGRLGFKPFGKDVPVLNGFQYGIQGIVDLNPALEATDPAALGDPLFLAAGMDLTLFKLDLGLFSALVFADIGTFVPYYRTVPTNYPNVPEGWAVKSFWDGNQLKNFGWSTGVFGNVAMVDYRLDFRFSRGLYRPQVFQATYPRTRVEYLKTINQYLQNAYTNNPNPIDDYTVTGIYGSAGANFFDRVRFSLSYLWPWYLEGGQLKYGEDDLFAIRFELKRDTIPVVNLWGSLSYERTKFAPTLLGWTGSGVHLFDANTVLKGEVFYPLAKGLNLVTLVSTAVAIDGNGQVIYLADGVTPKIQPNITLEIRLGF